METTTAQAHEQDSSTTATVTAETATTEPLSAGASAGAASTHIAVATPAAAIDPVKMEQLVIDALHSIYDPEIPVDIYELGLIYGIAVSPDGKIAITMTLTTPACPVAGSMPGEVEKTVRLIDGVTDVVVDLVWEPTWGPAMMTEAARLQLGVPANRAEPRAGRVGEDHVVPSLGREGERQARVGRLRLDDR